MEVYNKNRDTNNSMHDEIREQNAKLKDAPFREKLDYFRDYYLKTTIVAVVVIVFVGYLSDKLLFSPLEKRLRATRGAIWV